MRGGTQALLYGEGNLDRVSNQVGGPVDDGFDVRIHADLLWRVVELRALVIDLDGPVSLHAEHLVHDLVDVLAMVGPELSRSVLRTDQRRGRSAILEQSADALPNADLLHPAHHGLAEIEGAVFHLERKRGTHEIVPQAFANREREMVVVGQAVRWRPWALLFTRAYRRLRPLVGDAASVS